MILASRYGDKAFGRFSNWQQLLNWMMWLNISNFAWCWSPFEGLVLTTKSGGRSIKEESGGYFGIATAVGGIRAEILWSPSTTFG